MHVTLFVTCSLRCIKASCALFFCCYYSRCVIHRSGRIGGSFDAKTCVPETCKGFSYTQNVEQLVSLPSSAEVVDLELHNNCADARSLNWRSMDELHYLRISCTNGAPVPHDILRQIVNDTPNLRFLVLKHSPSFSWVGGPVVFLDEQDQNSCCTERHHVFAHYLDLGVEF